MKKSASSQIVYQSEHYKFVRTDFTKRSMIKVIDTAGNIDATFRFNNVPPFEHQYLSWENGNADITNDVEYQFNAVQQHKRLVAESYHYKSGVKELTDLQKNIMHIVRQFQDVGIRISNRSDEVDDFGEPFTFIALRICRKGKLSDFFDINEIIGAYSKHDISLSAENLKPYFETSLLDIAGDKFGSYDLFDPKTTEEIVVSGLILGYPIETRVQSIQ